MSIAFDAAGGDEGAGTSLSITHTCTGSNRILIAFIYAQGSSGLAPSFASATYNGASMTLATQYSVGQRFSAMIYLVNPSTGSHTMTVNFEQGESAIVLNIIVSASYTGVRQTGQPDSVNTLDMDASSKTAVTNVVADNSWVVAGWRDPSAGVISGVTQRGTVHLSSMIADTNAGVPPGSTNGPVFTAANVNGEIVVMSIAPTPIINTNFLAMFR